MTTTYTLTDDWQQIAQGSSTVTLDEGRNAWLYSGMTAPPDNTNYTLLSVRSPVSSYKGSLKTFARVAENSSGVRTKISVVEDGSSQTQEVADGNSIYLPQSTMGSGKIQAGDNEEWCSIVWGTDGSPTITSGSENTSDIDTPGNLCLLQSDNKVEVKNQLGEAKTITYNIQYI